jgi:hypothetical protein
MYSLLSVLILAGQVCSLPQTFNNEIMALSSAIDISNIICSSLEMTSSVVALRDEDIIINSAFQRLVERYRRTLQ